MSMTSCKECGNQVSTKAKTCPKCGAKTSSGWGIGKVLVAIIVIGAVVGAVTGSIEGDKRAQSEASAEATRRAALTPEQRKAEDEAKVLDEQRGNARIACEEFVKKTLHDPGSAEFSDFRTYPASRAKNGIWTVTVTGRAKNGFNALRQLAVRCQTELTNGNWVALSLKEMN